jgi:integrase
VRGSVFLLATVRVLSWRVIRHRARAAGVHAPIGNHSLRATGITEYLSDGGSIASSDISAHHAAQETLKVQASPMLQLTTSTAG